VQGFWLEHPLVVVSLPEVPEVPPSVRVSLVGVSETPFSLLSPSSEQAVRAKSAQTHKKHTQNALVDAINGEGFITKLVGCGACRA
jgi:hypothetical protein